MVDPFASHNVGLNSPCTRHYAVTLDSPGPTELDPRPRRLFVVTTGDVEIIDEAGEAVLYEAVPAGTTIDFRAVALGGDTTADIIAWL